MYLVDLKMISFETINVCGEETLRVDSSPGRSLHTPAIAVVKIGRLYVARIDCKYFHLELADGTIKLAVFHPTYDRDHWHFSINGKDCIDGYLARIVASGKLFKQKYEEGQPNTPQPFTGGTTDEVEAWLWDLAVQEEWQAQQKASAAAPPAQMDLFA